MPFKALCDILRWYNSKDIKIYKIIRSVWSASRGIIEVNSFKRKTIDFKKISFR